MAPPPRDPSADESTGGQTTQPRQVKDTIVEMLPVCLNATQRSILASAASSRVIPPLGMRYAVQDFSAHQMGKLDQPWHVQLAMTPPPCAVGGYGQSLAMGHLRDCLH